MGRSGDHPSEAAGLHRFPLGRRALVTTGLVAGYTLATTTVEAQAIHTVTTGLNADSRIMHVGDWTLPCYAASPQSGGPFATILVIEEIFGVHEYIRDVCRRLAHLGYLAIAPELYARIADLSQMTDAAQIVRDVISKAPDATMLSDLDNTVRWAAESMGDPSRLGVMGFCRGGRDTWLYAEHNPTLKAAVAWYGPVNTPDTPIQPHSPLDEAAALKCPLLGLYGGQDTSIQLSDVQEAAQKARAAGQTVDIVVYPDAPHGFHADYRPSYRKADAENGWNRAIAWFEKYGVK